MKERMKSKGIVIIMFITIILIVPIISAGFFEDTWNKITGKVSERAITLNISVSSGAPTIWAVQNASSAIVLNDGPSPTFITINFSVTDPDGAVNLNNASAAINLTKAGEDLRANSSCAVKDFVGNYANYTCNITLWWWDVGAVDWKISANISDLGGNLGLNSSRFVTINSLTGFVMSPSALTFNGMVAGAVNQTPVEYLLLNNTGNTDVGVGNVQINATDLVGETNKNKFLWASNFSVSTLTGGNIECNVTANAVAMVNTTFTAVTGTNITAGNFSINNGAAGQEKAYVCLRKVGVELTQQAYSTSQYGSWTVKIV